VVKVFGPAGVRAQILDTVTPFLNARTADYLSVLSDGAMQAIWTTLTKSATGDLKEKFSIEVTHSKGADEFAGLSGGEKRKVRLACALALQDLVASRATQPIDLWIGDEVDDALDPSGLERLMTILERKARERGTVLVISHSDLRDWIDNVTTVTKQGQWQSVVEGSLCD
jgi:DNA repair exonuclease SbcCD ATPase subunit